MFKKEGELEPVISQLITGLGEDITREGIVKTPHRVEKAMRYLTNGYHQSIEDVVNGALFEAEGSEMIVVKDIEFYSMCEHHMLPFFGKAHIAYIPNKHILGLSKFARITVGRDRERSSIGRLASNPKTDCGSNGIM